MKKLLSITYALLLLVVQSVGQSIVTVSPQFKSAILEEFTGIHCGYCPDGHLIASTLRNNNPDRVILVNIHTGSYAVPSTGEPDYQTQWGDAIALQSDLTGYPAGTVNRHVYTTAQTPGGTANGRSTWGAMASEIMLEVSPVNVGASSSFNSSTNELTIDVEAYYTSNSSTATNYINVVLIQDSLLGPQSGGATYNPTNYVGADYVHGHMLRDMITGQWGDVISTTTQGSLYTNQYVYTVPADVNGLPIDVSNCHVVVFVTETYQEIYTGVSIDADGGYDDGNHAPFIGDFSGLTNQAVEGSNGVVSSFSFSISPLIVGANDYIFDLTSDQPNDWTSSYSVDGNTYSTSQTLSLTNGTTSNITIDVTPGASPSISNYTLTMTMASDSNAVQTQKVFVISGITDLVVNGSGGNGAGVGNGAVDYEAEFTDGLTYAGNSAFDATEADVMIMLSDNSALSNVNNIYYNIGWTFPSLADEDATTLESFLDNGGNLLIAGQDIGWDIESGSGYGTTITQNFYTNYMNASYVDDGSASNSQYTAVASDPIFGTVGNTSIVDAYSGNIYPEQITPINGAEAIFNYNGNASKTGALRFDNGTFKLVYLGVALEMIGDNNIKDEIVKISHDWFNGTITSNEVNFNNIISIYPNPASDQLIIQSEETINNYKIINMLGEIVTTETNFNQIEQKVIDISDLDNGNYSIVIEQENSVRNLKFIVLK